MSKRRLVLLATLGAIILAASGLFLMRGGPARPVAEAQTPAATPTSQPAGPAGTRLLAAPGIVEPVNEEREVGSEVIGLIQEITVEENDDVRRGQVLAVIQNAEQKARLESARAELALRKAELERLQNGARPEERREQRALLAEAEASLALAKREFDRRSSLVANGNASEQALDQARANLRSAEARRSAAQERLTVIDTPPRREDVEAARARVDLADANVQQAQAALDRTFLKSPVDGVVLRRLKVAGEAVGNQPPTVVAVVGDISRLRVRAEVDEIDIARVAERQRVDVVADAYPGKRFGGTVARVNKRLGGKNINTGRARDRTDTKVLQVMIDLDADVKLPVGLRVDVFFSNGN